MKLRSCKKNNWLVDPIRSDSDSIRWMFEKKNTKLTYIGIVGEEQYHDVRFEYQNLHDPGTNKKKIQF